MTTATQVPKWKKADLAWLGLAVATHAGLLVIPVEVPDGEPPAPQRLTVELMNWRAEAEPLVPAVKDSNAETVAPTDLPDPESTWVEVLPREALAPEAISQPVDPSERSAEPDSVTRESESVENFFPDRLSTALLMNSAEQSDLPQVESGSRRILGAHSPRGLPSNRQRGNQTHPLLTDGPEIEIVMAPAQTEIVDRWLDAQGAQNVVVTLPNGETFCGRAQAWDPMQPLVEHIMLFRSCGGGGKRTFEMASRPTPRWSTAE